MNLPLPALFLPSLPVAYFPLAHWGGDGGRPDLIVIFAFVIAIIAISKWSRYQRDKLWHETARIALEKGQPVPDRWPSFAAGANRWERRRWRWSWFGPWWDIRRGLVLLAVGGALYFALDRSARDWMFLPMAIGSVYLLFGAVRLMAQGPNDESDPRDPPPKP